MADMTAPSGQAPAMAPPVRTDEETMPRNRAFTASSTILSRYIQLHTANIREASYYQEYQENVAKNRRFLAGEPGSTQDSPTPKPSKPAMKAKPTAQKARINIGQLLHLVLSFIDAFSASSSDKTWNLILRLKTRKIFRNLESFIGGRLREGDYRLLKRTVRETLVESTEGAPQFGPERSRENKMMLERFSQPTVDPLALLSNVSNPQHYSPLDDSSSLAKDLIENLTNTLALLTQSYRTFLPQTNNQLRTSSNARNQATVQDGRVVVQNVQGRPNRGQGMNPRGGNAAGYGGAQNRDGNVNQSQARPGQPRTVKCYNYNGTGHIARNCTQPKRPQNSEYFKDKMLLMEA
nr:hypothetical protein [Tanacetum cinerariifolium]